MTLREAVIAAIKGMLPPFMRAMYGGMLDRLTDEQINQFLNSLQAHGVYVIDKPGNLVLTSQSTVY